MARISGILLKSNKSVLFALKSIYGIGKFKILEICSNLNIDSKANISLLSDYTINLLKNELNKYEIEGNLRRKIELNIKRLYDIKCYRGLRHKLKLPVRGQRTKTNAKTSKKKKFFFYK